MQTPSISFQQPQPTVIPNNGSSNNSQLAPHASPLNSNLIPTRQDDKIVPAFISRFVNSSLIEKIVNVTLYEADFSTISTKSSDITKFINKFLRDIQTEVRKAPNSYFNTPKQIIQSLIKVSQQVLELKEDVNSRLITYDNIFQHFPKREMPVDKLLRDVCATRIVNIEQFRKEFDLVVQTIQSFNEISVIRTTLTHWDGFIADSTNDSASVLNLIKSYRDLVSASYNSLSQLTVVSKNELLDDYILLSDDRSVKKVANNMLKFLATGYSFYKTGFTLLDVNIGGLESSTFHLITGPSNHAKSILMINMIRNILLHNPGEFDKDTDVIVFITLEDDIYKLMRRFISIFGNIDTKLIQRLFVKASSLLKNQKNKDINNQSSLNSDILQILTDLLKQAIIKVTGKCCPLVLKHCNENIFAPSDATKFIDRLKLEGYHTKILAIDYVDVMVPSASNYSNYNDYDSQGAIIQELRLISRLYSIPVLSITQNNKGSENMTLNMGNDMIGDSYKKIRYSDYVYMIRMRSDLDLLSNAVQKDVTPQDQTNNVDISDISGEYVEQIKPFEIKITKAKEGKKDMVKFHLFSGTNIKIYNTLNDFFQDLTPYKNASTVLNNNIDLLGMNVSQQVGQLNVNFDLL